LSIKDQRFSRMAFCCHFAHKVALLHLPCDGKETKFSKDIGTDNQHVGNYLKKTEKHTQHLVIPMVEIFACWDQVLFREHNQCELQLF